MFILHEIDHKDVLLIDDTRMQSINFVLVQFLECMKLNFLECNYQNVWCKICRGTVMGCVILITIGMYGSFFMGSVTGMCGIDSVWVQLLGCVLLILYGCHVLLKQ